MKVLLQRVVSAAVAVNGETIGSIERGLTLFTGIGRDDDEVRMRAMAEKIARMRIFPDEQGRFHLSLLDVQGGALLIPQFTLFADTSKGRRPEFFGAMPPDQARPLFLRFAELMRELGVARVETGEFGAAMRVSVENDGPVSIMVEN